MVEDGTVLWEPPTDAVETTRMGDFLQHANEETGADMRSYYDLWAWSVDDLEEFWRILAAYFNVRFGHQPRSILTSRAMPGAEWFPDATLNYAEHALTRSGDATAVLARSQTRPDQQLSFDELRDQVSRATVGLRELGVRRGDRVAAYMPNIPETLVAFLATASIGAIWSSCSPEFGTQSVIDRFAQIEPTVLFTVDGYIYGDKTIDRRQDVAELRSALPTVSATVAVPYLRPETPVPDSISWERFTSQSGELTFTQVPFDHPLYILYSSGTTGIPKAIVHGHGGILVEHLKMLALHHDLGSKDRFFWFTSTGWMMWNYLVSGLLTNSAVVLFDGDPGFPDLETLWRLAADMGVTYFGVSASFLLNCRRAGLHPGRKLELGAIHGVGSTGSPLPAEGFEWVYHAIGKDLVLNSTSGGTDVCTAFVGANPLVPVRAGEISGRCLGAKVEAWNSRGEPVIGEKGELVITEPLPSMPVGFWKDEGGRRYRDAYFDVFPGVWRHGDWIRITERGTCVITGRSDATLNRGGVRTGTSELYRAIENLPDISDSLVVHLQNESVDRLILFISLADGSQLDSRLEGQVRQAIKLRVSPRHVPDEIHQVPDIPKTLSGKKLEIPIRRLLEGESPEVVVSAGALANPESIDAYVAFAQSRGR